MENIKARLAAGESVENLMKEMQDQVVAAAREVEVEKNRNTEVEDAREELVVSLINYLIALGFINEEEVDDNDVDALCEVMKECETELTAYVPVVRAMIDAEKAKAEKQNKTEPMFCARSTKMSEDDIIKNFLKNL